MIYEVTGTVTEDFTLLCVEAENEEEAKEEAIRRVLNGENYLLSDRYPEVNIYSVTKSHEYE